MSKILVFGGTGMLGKKVIQEAGSDNVLAPIRNICNLEDVGSLYFYLDEHQDEFDTIINCAGIVNSRKVPNSWYIELNSLAPHWIAEWARIHSKCVIHVSTDCVFSGNNGRGGPISRKRQPDPTDVYGKSKWLGEVEAGHVTNVRTSFIGFGKHGLLNWLLENKGKSVQAWGNAYWSGSTALSVARSLVAMTQMIGLSNIEHLSTDVEITKAGLIFALNNALDLGLEIEIVQNPVIYRALSPTLKLKNITEMMPELVREYHDLYNKN